MSNFVVSARKYRPNRFDEVVGQNHISKTLKNALKTDHLGHSFLFCGPRGVGKTTSARILAKVLNCEQRTEDFEPCNECSSCTAFTEQHSFNIYELDAASNNSVDNIRDLVEQVRFPPQQGQYKVYIIDEVHMLSASAFNAFLKTLEEPPSYAIFILATTEKHKIIPTILSRCQIFDFNRVQVGDITEHLKMICAEEGITAEEKGLHIIAQKADGALRDALSLFDRIVSFSGNQITYEQVTEALNILDYDTFFTLTNSLLLQDKNQILIQFNDILNRGFDGDQVVLGLAEHFRNLLVARNPETAQLLEVAKDVQDRFFEQAQVAELSFLLNGLNITNACDVGYKMAKNKRLHVELALLKMCYLNQIESDVPLSVEKKNDKPSALTKTDKVEETKDSLPTENFQENTNQEVIDESQSAEQESNKKKILAEGEKPDSQITENRISENDNYQIRENINNLEEPSPNKMKKNLTSTLNFQLSNLHQKIGNTKNQNSKPTIQEDHESDNALKIKIEKPNELLDAWKSLVHHFPESQALQNVIKESKVAIENHQLIITVQGNVSKQLLESEHLSIVNFLKEKTNLMGIPYSIIAEERDLGQEKHMTKEEQFQYIKNQNPAIALLADRLNLEIDYDQ